MREQVGRREEEEAEEEEEADEDEPGGTDRTPHKDVGKKHGTLWKMMVLQGA